MKALPLPTRRVASLVFTTTVPAPLRRIWLALVIVPSLIAAAPATSPRPNFLWISLEDTSPDLGCYGVELVTTPHIDRLAKNGVRMARAFSTAGVCAPSRSGLICGVYQTAIGTQHMRSNMPRPAGVPTLPEVLRDAGYYCSNNSKQDYNFDGRGLWSASDPEAHWRNRDRGKPFFSVFNITTTHEGSTFNLKNGAQRLEALGLGDRIVSPDRVRVPSYYVDNDIVRQHIANYYNLISAADHRIGELLAELKADGLEEDTIVFIWGDHGRGLPRAKFWNYTASTHVPLVVYAPSRFREALAIKPGHVDLELRSLLDLFPSVLDAAGIARPSHLHGHSFFRRAAGHTSLLAARDRLGPRQDLTRAIRTGEWLYIRNFVHDGAYVPTTMTWYTGRSPIQQQMWKHAPDRVGGPKSFFSAEERPAEELYRWQDDRDEINNLAGSPGAQAQLRALREALLRKMNETGDTGFVPEHDLLQQLTELHRTGRSPIATTRSRWPSPPPWMVTPLEFSPQNFDRMRRELSSAETVRRYWALRTIINWDKQTPDEAVTSLAPLLRDTSIDVQLQAVRLFAVHGRFDAIEAPLRDGLQHPYAWARTIALGIIADLPENIARAYVPFLEKTKDGGYVGMMRPFLLKRLSTP